MWVEHLVRTGAWLLVLSTMVFIGGCEEWFAAEDDATEQSGGDRGGDDEPAEPRREPEPPGPNSCEGAYNGVCDEGLAFCRFGTDTADCSEPNSCRWAHDGICQGDGIQCPVGTDTADCTEPEEPEEEPEDDPETERGPNTAAPECLESRIEQPPPVYVYDDSFEGSWVDPPPIVVWNNVCEESISVAWCRHERLPCNSSLSTNPYITCEQNPQQNYNPVCGEHRVRPNRYIYDLVLDAEQPFYTFSRCIAAGEDYEHLLHQHDHDWRDEGRLQEYDHKTSYIEPDESYSYAVCRGRMRGMTETALEYHDVEPRQFFSDSGGNYGCYPLHRSRDCGGATSR